MKPLNWKTLRSVQRSCEVADVADRVLRFAGGIIEVEVAPGERIQIELFTRHSSDLGIRVRGIDSSIDIEPEGGNCVVVKPRGHR